MHIGPSVVIQLRKRYRDAWSREWPHSNNDLAQLWGESKEMCGSAMGAQREECYRFCLDLMRECDSF